VDFRSRLTVDYTPSGDISMRGCRPGHTRQPVLVLVVLACISSAVALANWPGVTELC